MQRNVRAAAVGAITRARRESPADRENPASTTEAAATVQPMGRVDGNDFFM